MAIRKNTRHKARTGAPDWPGIAARFLEIRCLLECVTRSLQELQEPSDPDEDGIDCESEIVCLRLAQKQFREAHYEMNMAIDHLHSQEQQPEKP